VRASQRGLMRWGALAVLVFSLGCSKSDSVSTADASPGCQKDTDCKGDRVCERGACVSHPTQPPSPPAQPEVPRPQPTRISGAPCAISYGLEGPPRTMGQPREVEATVEVASRLAVYSTGKSGLSVVAPRGWSCEGVVAVDGSESIGVFPLGGTKGNGAFKSSSGQGVTADSIPACQGCVAFFACPLFPSALRDWPGMTCDDVVPAAKRILRQNASTVFFEDPPGVSGDGNPSGGPYPANGVIRFSAAADKPPRGASASGATCTLPEADHALCTVILNDFLAHW
jgi:hypothetical protein